MDKKLKSKLKKTSMSLQAIMQIGKNSLTREHIISINQYLEKHELMKIKLLASATEDKAEITKNILTSTNSLLINSIGGVIVIYRRNEELHNKPKSTPKNKWR